LSHSLSHNTEHHGEIVSSLISSSQRPGLHSLSRYQLSWWLCDFTQSLQKRYDWTVPYRQPTTAFCHTKVILPFSLT